MSQETFLLQRTPLVFTVRPTEEEAGKPRAVWDCSLNQFFLRTPPTIFIPATPPLAYICRPIKGTPGRKQISPGICNAPQPFQETGSVWEDGRWFQYPLTMENHGHPLQSHPIRELKYYRWQKIFLEIFMPDLEDTSQGHQLSHSEAASTFHPIAAKLGGRMGWILRFNQ